MLIRTNNRGLSCVAGIIFSLILAPGLILGGGGETGGTISKQCLENVLKDMKENIQGFLALNVGTGLQVYSVAQPFSDFKANYLCIYLPERSKCVLFQLSVDGGCVVENFGFGERDQAGNWLLYHEDSLTGKIYESLGGEWVHRRISEVMEMGYESKQRVPLSWK